MEYFGPGHLSRAHFLRVWGRIPLTVSLSLLGLVLCSPVTSLRTSWSLGVVGRKRERVPRSGDSAAFLPLLAWDVLASTITVYGSRNQPNFSVPNQKLDTETTEKAELNIKGCGLVSWNHEIFCWAYFLTHGGSFCLSGPHFQILLSKT